MKNPQNLVNVVYGCPLGVLLKEARERIIHSEPQLKSNQNESLGIVFL